MNRWVSHRFYRGSLLMGIAAQCMVTTAEAQYVLKDSTPPAASNAASASAPASPPPATPQAPATATAPATAAPATAAPATPAPATPAPATPAPATASPAVMPHASGAPVTGSPAPDPNPAFAPAPGSHAASSEPARSVAAGDGSESPSRNLSLTLSPLHLFMPMFEVMAELRLFGQKRPLSVAAIAGVGQLKRTVTTGSRNDTATGTAYEIGGQLVYYPLGDFKSLQLGVEALYLEVDVDLQQDQSLSGKGFGLAVGPFVGYKAITSGGFTFVAQLGIDYLALNADASDSDTGETSSSSESRWAPLLNLNIGWSF